MARATWRATTRFASEFSPPAESTRRLECELSRTRFRALTLPRPSQQYGAAKRPGHSRLFPFSDWSKTVAENLNLNHCIAP